MRRSRARTRAAWLGLGFAVAVSAVGGGAHAQTKAPSADDLRSAREMFQEAYKDEQEQRYAQALDKFQRVAAVKESASVRYRIGSVLELLGRLRESRDAFRALAASKATLSVPEQEIADNSAERAHQLDKKIPRLLLRLQANPPPDTRVSIDGAPVPASTTPRPIELDPGEHLVRATSAASSLSSESKVTLTEGGEVEVVVVLDPLANAAAGGPSSPGPADTGSRRNDTLAFVALGAGGVLLVTGIILLGIREGDISDITKACGQNGSCPSSKQADIQGWHDEAQLFGPLGVGFALVGLAAAGTGGYLLFRPDPASTQPAATQPAKSTTTLSPTGGLRIVPRPLQGGGMLGLSAVF